MKIDYNYKDFIDHEILSEIIDQLLERRRKINDNKINIFRIEYNRGTKHQKFQEFIKNER